PRVVDPCEKCGDAIQAVEMRPGRGRGPGTMLGCCRKCGARYRRTGTVEWIADRDYPAHKPGESI
ncbi:MAG: hypothetical protein ABIP53_05310, partial [Candidatus Limnocylindrales bacterium]